MSKLQIVPWVGDGHAYNLLNTFGENWRNRIVTRKREVEVRVKDL